MSRRVGHRFHPTDEEIITYFLKHKMDGSDSLVDEDIREIEICKCEPWELPGYAVMGSNDQLWYFFCPQDYKYANSRRVNRSTRGGYWKSTGRDRTIKAKRTKKEIGTKKTLVFYKGRVPHGVKTNWIIHEYQPKTILPHQRAFVLCKLKNKVDEKADTSACDEGEPSHHIPSNFQNHPIEIPILQEDVEVFPESIIASNAFDFNHPSVQQSQIHIDLGPSFEDTWFTNGFSNGNNELGFQFDANTQEDIKLADSFLVDPDGYQSSENSLFIFPDEYNHEATASTLLNDSIPLNTLRWMCSEDISDTDIQTIRREPSQRLGPSHMSDGHSKEYRQMRTVQAFTETLAPSIYEQCRKEKNGSYHDEIVVMMAGSVGSDTDEDIKYIELVNKEFPVYARTNKPQHQPRSGNIAEVREAAPRRSQLRAKLSKTVSEHKVRKATKNSSEIDLPKKESSINFPKKENFVVESKKDWKMAPAETSLKSRTNGSAGNSKLGSFICLETPPLSHKQCPPSVYVVNVLVGLVLFIVFTREVFVLS